MIAVVTIFSSILLNCFFPKCSTVRNIISNKNVKLDIKTTLGTVREIVLFYSLFIKAVEMSHVNNRFSSTVIKEMSGIIKLHIFKEGHKMLRNLYRTFDWHYIGQK